MLSIYSVSLQVTRECVAIVRAIAVRDRNLADQLDRASTAVPLHIAEADGLRGGLRRVRHTTALGEAREVCACIDVAVAKGHIEWPPTLGSKLDHVIGVLVKVSRH